MLSKTKIPLFLLLLLLLTLKVAQPSQAHPTLSLQAVQAKIEPQLLQEFESKNSTDFFLWLVEQADLTASASLLSKTDRGQFVLDTLQQTADSSQQSLRTFLDTQGATYQPYYIANTILVQGGDEALLLALAARDDIAHIYANHTFQLPEPFRSKNQADNPQTIEPNLSFINADDVWGLGIIGQNTVLAGNDTGLIWDHPAIFSHYRGWDGTTADHNYNWWDATGTYPAIPGDGHGHGTHTTGTMVGDDGSGNQIGVAPGAKTIHCKNMDNSGSGVDSWFLTCFQWDLAPWDLSGNNPDPSKAPDAINNSWGYWGGNNPIFQTAIANLQTAGILVEVSAGNEGPNCTTLRSPSDYGEVLTTGSVNHAGGSLPGSITDFSSRGPSLLSSENIPDIMAPGENIRSAVPGGSYEYWSGTSMAGPHATALIGLMWSANPGLRGLVAETNGIIAQTAVPLTGQTGSNCGGDYTDGPNNDWGYGTIDALAAVNAAILYGDPGTLTGTVTDASTTAPLEDVTVTAALTEDLDWQRQTDANGVYSMLIFSGTYTVTAELYGYLPETVPGVQITSFQTTTLDMALDPAPIYTVSGAVTDVNTGWPLYARLDIIGYPYGPVWTDPATGQYEVELAGGIDYVFQVSSWVGGYDTAVRPLPALTSNQTEDFALEANSFACNAPGYSPQFAYFEDFEGDDGGYTATGGFTSWEWGAPSSGPGAAHSGSNVWATNLSGNYFDGEFGHATSPDIDLSAYSGQTIIVTWWQWLQTESGFDYAFVEVSNDGGTNWYTYYGWVSGDISTSWQKQAIVLDPSYAVSNFRVRFGLSTDGSVTLPGFYVDDVGIGAANTPPPIYSQNFEASDGSFVTAGSNSSWAWGIPTRGPSAAHSGQNVWGTNLDDNYNNNEESYVTSPDIDLSGYTGQLVQLTWWQWLQTELNYDFASVDFSNDGGATWTTIYGPVSGPTYHDWYQLLLEVDASYLVSNFRVRFTLDSDSNVTYPGYYVDDLVISTYTVEPPTLPCAAPTGGLVVGNVYEANTGDGLNGAVVTDDAGNSTISQATALDTAVADGFYILYSPAGAHDLTASKAQYADDVQNVNVIAGQTIVQDFNLGAGLLSANPLSLAATLDMGESANLSLTLDNNGSLSADFKLREADQGMTPAVQGSGAALQRLPGQFSPAANLSSLLPHSSAPLLPRSADLPWTDITPFPTAIMDHAAAEYEGRVYVVGGLTASGLTSGGYVYDPATISWSAIANMANARQKPSAAFVGDLLYVVGGWDFDGNPVSALEIYDPAADSWTTGANMPVPVAGAPAVALEGYLYVIGGCLDGFCTATSNVYRYDVAADAWQNIAAYPEPTSWQSCGAIEGQIYCAGGAGVTETNGTYGYDPASDSWTQLANMVQTQWGSAFVAANGRLYISAGVTANFSLVTNETFYYDPATDTWTQDANANHALYRTASACGFYKIGGSSSGFSPTADSELYPGLTECGALSDVPWLSMAPITGTIDAGGSQIISVTLDAGVPEVTQPGDYLAQIRVSDNTPYQLAAIPVTMTVNAPADWGKVAGLVTGLARCDEPGAPLNQADVAIGVTAVTSTNNSGNYTYWLPNGTYTMTVSANGYVTQAMTVTITAGQTTDQDVALRLDAPCAAESPTEFNVTVQAGGTLTADLHLHNEGAADLTYSILETTYDLAASAATLRTPAEAVGLYSSAALPGPLSAQALNLASGRLESPESNWFGGADIPGGIIRYAHAQCDEQPNSFYVISGVDGNLSVTGNAWRYDALTNSWTPLAPMPMGQEGPTAVCYQNRLYVMGGGGSNQFYIYDIATNSWAAGAPLPRGVWGAAAAAWDGQVYLVGGDSDFFIGGTSNEVNIYDIASDTWSGTGEPMPTGAVTPGYVQAGLHLYIVGGWDDFAPTTNVAAAQRYDLMNNVWEIGPSLAYPRADLALAMTSEALYAIGGDGEGGFFFDPTTTVERLELATWSSGSWSDAIDQLPTGITAVQAGFCTAGFFPAQVWAVGGVDGNAITAGNRFLGRPSESCFSIYEDVPWLSETPISGTVTADTTNSVTITFDATNLAPGIYQATLVIPNNDAGAPLLRIPVTLTVPGQQQLFLPFITKNAPP